MKYMKIYINCKPELIETAGAVLIANDIAGYVTNAPSNLDHLEETDIPPWDYIDDELRDEIKSASNIEFYLPEDEQGKALLNRINEHILSLDNSDEFKLSVENADDSTWLNKWKEFFKPLKIGEHFYIKPSWETINEKHNRHVIEIDPENSFGSGTHATTQLCLMEAESQKPEDKAILDLGCGSGILGIGAKLLGCNNVTFVDIDKHCIVTSQKNAEKNHLDTTNMEFLWGNILDDTALVNKIGHNKYDIMFVNIMADIIIAMIPILDTFIKDDGVIIFSGIITQRLDDVLNALEENDYNVINVRTIENWCSVTASK